MPFGLIMKRKGDFSWLSLSTLDGGSPSPASTVAPEKWKEQWDSGKAQNEAYMLAYNKYLCHTESIRANNCSFQYYLSQHSLLALMHFACSWNYISWRRVTFPCSLKIIPLPSVESCISLPEIIFIFPLQLSCTEMYILYEQCLGAAVTPFWLECARESPRTKAHFK